VRSPEKQLEKKRGHDEYKLDDHRSRSPPRSRSLSEIMPHRPTPQGQTQSQKKYKQDEVKK
jgi:hypothetical protein